VRVAMNRNHQLLCASGEWAEHIRDDLLPWVLGERTLGGSELEIGPGPGLTTDVLRRWTRRLTAVEADPRAASSLKRRLAGTNVTVINADGIDMPIKRARFTAGVAMTMLHHVPSIERQDALFAEVHRVLRRDGWLVGVDTLDSPGFRAFHRRDVCVPVEPEGLEPRLVAAGFAEVEIERCDHEFRFAARKPKE